MKTAFLTASLLTFSGMAAAASSIASIPGYQGVTTWEATYFPSAPEATFLPVGDARLTTVLAGAALSQAGRDFGTFLGNENYDVFLSNADGSLNANGAFITIDGNCDVPFQCFNISEVALKVNGNNEFATGVVRAVYGRPGSFVANTAALAADGNLQTYTQLGDTMGNYPDGRMSITLSFASAVPEPTTWSLWAAGLALLGARRLRHQR
jgi:hypothetical protein